MANKDFIAYMNKCNALEHFRQSILIEIQNCGILYSFKVKPIKSFPGLLGIARDRNTKGCLTLRDYGDIAVYPDMSMKEVIDSFKAKDGAAECNAIYTETLEQAEACLRDFL